MYFSMTVGLLILVICKDIAIDAISKIISINQNLTCRAKFAFRSIKFVVIYLNWNIIIQQCQMRWLIPFVVGSFKTIKNCFYFVLSISILYVQGYNYCLSFQLPVSATEDKRSNVNFPSGFGYSIGLCFSLDVNVSLSVCPCFRVHGSIPRPRTQNRPKISMQISFRWL